MARVLIIGCGCRGQALARGLREEGHAVRGTTRNESRSEAIRAAGAEAYVGDPDRIGTLVYALDGVTIVVYLMGSPEGSDEVAAELNGTRLQMLFEKTVDTTVRGVVYEAAGSATQAALECGREITAEASARWEIPVATIDEDPVAHGPWLEAAQAAVTALLHSPQAK